MDKKERHHQKKSLQQRVAELKRQEENGLITEFTFIMLSKPLKNEIRAIEIQDMREQPDLQKIKSSEIRIGNLFQTIDGKKLTSVTDIKTMDFETWFFCCYGYEQFEVEPIPLDAEWLVKLGFQYDEDKEWLTLKYSDWVIDTDESVEFSLVYADTHGYKFAFAKTVHELQNLYFVLTGKEIIKS